jgi:4-amino-4-deoxy-L-arabinose transferase-like glycosyltransferase
VLALLQRHRRFFVSLTLAGFVLRAFFAIKFPQFTPDSRLYADLAKNWLTHHIYGQSDPTGIIPTYVRLPGYPAFLAGVFAIFGKDNYRAVLTLQVLFDMGTCFVLADAARRCIRTERAAQVAFALAALCPFLANYSGAVLTETLEVFATALAFDLAIAGLENIGALRIALKIWIGCGAAIGVAILLRPDGGLLAAAIGGYLGIDFLLRQRRQELVALLVLTVTVVACLVPWTLRNLHTFHKFQPLAPRYANTDEDFVSHGFNRWTKTWIADYVSTQEIYWAQPGEELDLDKLPERAFDDQQQFDATEQIFDDYNVDHTISPELDARFEALASERIRRSPFRYYVRLPYLRMADMWLRPRTELLPPDPRWWEFDDVPLWSAAAVAFGLINLFYVGAALQGFPRFARRVAGSQAGMMLLFLLLRTLFLGSMENPEPRYTLECYPVVILIAAACWKSPLKPDIP